MDVAALPEPVAITGPWDVHFPPNWGAPERVELPQLVSWTEHADPGVRYFSGKASYRKEIRIPPSMLEKGRRLYLDLGDVQVIADVKLNGRPSRRSLEAAVSGSTSPTRRARAPTRWSWTW